MSQPILKEGDIIIVKTYNDKFPYLSSGSMGFRTIQAYNVQPCGALYCTYSDCLTKQTFSTCEREGMFFSGVNCCNTSKFVVRKATEEEAWMYILYGSQEVERDG